jgi:four helix bundle protein
VGIDVRDERVVIRSYKDLRVYQDSYSASISVIMEMIPRIPKEEKYDLADQLRRSAKAIPRLIAEGYAKKASEKTFSEIYR